MLTYVTHKLLALIFIGGLSVLSFTLYPDVHQSRWFVLLLVMTVFGYSHYAVGAVYQLRSFTRKQDPVRWYRWFTGLTLVSLAVCGIFFLYGQIGILAFTVIGYFMVHGLFNEVTLFERQTNLRADRFTIYAIASSLLGAAFLAVGHASWFFAPDLTFMAISTPGLTSYLLTDPIPQITRLLGIICFTSAVIAQLWATLRKTAHRYFHLIVLGLVLVIAIVGWTWYPLHYVFILSSLLLYHFVVWFMFYADQFWRSRRTELPLYLGVHALVLLPFIALLLPDTYLGAVVDTYLLNSYLFLTLTAMHISVSFLSERWLQEWLHLR